VWSRDQQHQKQQREQQKNDGYEEDKSTDIYVIGAVAREQQHGGPVYAAIGPDTAARDVNKDTSTNNDESVIYTELESRD